MFFFFTDPATTEIYTLSLHDALPILPFIERLSAEGLPVNLAISLHAPDDALRSSMIPVNRKYPIARLTGKDRKSTRLNSSHANISYAVFCLKKKKNKTKQQNTLN